MRLLFWILILPVAAVAIVFAVANRAPVRVSLDPLPVALDLPLYLVVFLAIFAGIVIGGTASRIAAWRRATRRAATERPSQPAEPPSKSGRGVEPRDKILLPPPVA